MIGSAGRPSSATDSRSRRLEPVGRREHRGEAADEEQHDEHEREQQEQDRLVEQRLEVERHAGVDEEDRHEESERDGLDLALDGLAVGLLGVAHDEPPHDARGERAEQHVEVEHDAQRDERRRG